MNRRQLRMVPESPLVPAHSACVVTTDSACEVSTITNDSASSTSRRAITINNKTVRDPEFNNRRLVFTRDCHHLPSAPKKMSECQLHKWCFKGTKINAGRKKKQICYCKTCNVNLCLSCYSIFHTVRDLDRIRDRITASNDERYSDLSLFV